MKDSSKIDQYVQSYIVGDISQEDLEKLILWGKKKRENQMLIDILSSNEDLRKRLSDYYGLRSPIYWNKVKAEMSRRKRKIAIRKLSKIAAAILLPIIVGTFVYINNSTIETDQVETLKQFTPGNKNATLLVSDNMTINLDTVEIGKLDTKSKTNIVKESKGKLSYKIPEQKLPKDAKTVYHTLWVAKGEEYELELSDGTVLFLNSETRIRYPVLFAGTTREIFMEEGEVYLDVAHQASREFVVKTPQSTIEVLGTRFNISAYKGEYEVATLLEGSIDLVHHFESDKPSRVRLKPGEQAQITNRKVEVKQVNADDYIAWTKGIFYFNYDSLETIARKLSRWYKVGFSFEDEEVKNLSFYGKLKRYESIDVLLEQIKLTNKIDYTLEGNTIHIIKK